MGRTVNCRASQNPESPCGDFVRESRGAILCIMRTRPRPSSPVFGASGEYWDLAGLGLKRWRDRTEKSSETPRTFASAVAMVGGRGF